MDMGWVRPWVGLGRVGLNEKYCYFSLHFVFVIILCATKICKLDDAVAS